MNESNIIDLYINKAKDERTVMAKNNFKNVRRITINEAHTVTVKPKPMHDLQNQLKNVGYTISTTVHIFVHRFKHNNQQV